MRIAIVNDLALAHVLDELADRARDLIRRHRGQTVVSSSAGGEGTDWSDDPVAVDETGRDVFHRQHADC